MQYEIILKDSHRVITMDENLYPKIMGNGRILAFMFIPYSEDCEGSNEEEYRIHSIYPMRNVFCVRKIKGKIKEEKDDGTYAGGL